VKKIALCVLTPLVAGLVALYTGVAPLAAQDAKKTLVIDVAQDANTFAFNMVNPSATINARGDTFIVNGTIYPGGTLPAGNANNSPNDSGGIGVWYCSGVLLADGNQLNAGVTPIVSTNQLYMLPNDQRSLVSDGIEPNVGFSNVRAVVGGTGKYRGARGSVVQQALGTNATGGFNLRFTFNLDK
jgi:hypothetical protein